MKELLELLNENCQLIIQKDGSGRVDNIETGEAFIFFDNINNLKTDLINNPLCII